MKKLLAVILAAMMAVSVAGCSAITSSADSKEPAKTEAKDSGTLGDYTVAIKSARLSKDYDGKKVVVVKYSFTNNSDESASFFSISTSVFQDKVELDTATADDESEYLENGMKEIKKGATIEVEEAYKLSNEKSEIEVEASEMISLKDDKITKTFDITALK